MQFVKKHWREIVVAVFLFATISIWYLVFAHRQTNLLRVYFFDVGKGDSILIDSPTHARVLIDGGLDATVLTRLGQILPFEERNIDVMIEANPSAGSITGLVNVLKEYKVGMFLSPEISSTSYAHTLLNEQIRNLNIKKVVAKPGTTIDLGRGAQLQFLFSKSAIAQVVYGTQTILLNATSTQKMIEIETDGETIR
jgi:beta-lactamase superfamily II metal-dependent hydrolase